MSVKRSKDIEGKVRYAVRFSCPVCSHFQVVMLPTGRTATKSWLCGMCGLRFVGKTGSIESYGRGTKDEGETDVEINDK